MTPDEIRKLLGGYATNTLSADERKVLFDAALEDQELFNALANEDALREVLDDPVTREQARSALASRPDRRPTFWSKRWLLGVAVPAALAVIVIVLMNRARPPEETTQPVQIALNTPTTPPKRAAPATAPLRSEPPRVQAGKKSVAPRAIEELAKRESATKELAANAPDTNELARTIPPPTAASPEPVIPAPVQAQAPKARPMAAPAIASFRAAGTAPLPDAIRQQFATAVIANAPRYRGPLAQSTLLRSPQDNSEIRVQVSSGVTGYLALYKCDATGAWMRIYPPKEVAAPVAASVSIQIPDNPIRVLPGERLAVAIVPAPTPATTGQIGGVGVVGGVADAAAPRTMVQSAVPAGNPLVLEIPLAP